MKTKWINIKDKLPEWGVPVLIFQHNSLLHPGEVGKLESITEDGPIFASNNRMVQGITYWCSLPAPPEEED